jgi:hypothetical protein
VYTGVVIVNYLVCILGVGTGLAALGLDYRLARGPAPAAKLCICMPPCAEWCSAMSGARTILVHQPDDPGAGGTSAWHNWCASGVSS